ncbi:2-C-methyl-D-erythritol 4-phosphate cytidylyltransferase [Desulforhopalus singaporensis]|uniref:Bifunctional enzyme IspD/IspF n=1 Tax=Desulforhopalus singaporensis TaxID=91360 RepID=A0A1H0S9E6_9BACT|nr:2-C-methyl-D-erythritol 4-phosphate cytidylyltransferase [Desulforhopalus singaporensis]SDP37828.1 2-C-methyl-D-erythritol 2,4-cyclodiphosphate synthase [Desulforhopalus singaporensis]
MSLKAAVIIPAAGFGTRMKLDHPKQFHKLAGAPILVHTLRAFIDHPAIEEIVVVVPRDQLAHTRELFAQYAPEAANKNLSLVAGGARRQDSVYNGLKALSDRCRVVLVHDGARPLVSPEVINRCYQGAVEHGAAIAAVPVKDTLKMADLDGFIDKTVDRTTLYQAQTPQAAMKTLLQQAYEHNGDRDVTDEASLLENASIPVQLVEGAETNFKITRPEDLVVAQRLLSEQHIPVMRIGHGYDAHRLEENKKLVLGGVTIPHTHGLAAHSDGDVLTHALCDALLGAVCAGDIGGHFPDTDNRYKGIYSIKLLEEVIGVVLSRGYIVANADITVVCQAPKLAPYLERMKTLLAKTCQTVPENLNIKATTTEKMGFEGKKIGISCHAVVLLQKDS